MSSGGEPRDRGEDAAHDPVDELVRHQQQIVRDWSRLANGLVELAQSGSVDPSRYVDAYAQFVTRTAASVAGALRALSRL